MSKKSPGNRQATGKAIKRGAQIAARTRGAILNAFDAVEQRGRVISEILADSFIENPLKFLDTAAKYVPKDINLTNNIKKDSKDYTDDELQEMIAERARARREQIEQQLRDGQQDQEKHAQIGPYKP